MQSLIHADSRLPVTSIWSGHCKPWYMLILDFLFPSFGLTITNLVTCWFWLPVTSIWSDHHKPWYMLILNFLFPSSVLTITNLRTCCCPFVAFASVCRMYLRNYCSIHNQSQPLRELWWDCFWDIPLNKRVTCIAIDKRGYPHNIFLISQWKHTLWVLIRSASPRHF